MLATMACALPYAIAAALAFPGRQVVAFTGDGGLSMLIGELATIVRYKLPIKIVVMKNNSPGPDQVGAAHVPGQSRVRVRPHAHRFRARWRKASASPDFAPTRRRTAARRWMRRWPVHGPALVEATVDPYEPLLPAKRIEKYAENLEKALDKGTRDAPQIRAALEREPSRTQLS